MDSLIANPTAYWDPIPFRFGLGALAFGILLALGLLQTSWQWFARLELFSRIREPLLLAALFFAPMAIQKHASVEFPDRDDRVAIALLAARSIPQHEGVLTIGAGRRGALWLASRPLPPFDSGTFAELAPRWVGDIFRANAIAAGALLIAMYGVARKVVSPTLAALPPLMALFATDFAHSLVLPNAELGALACAVASLAFVPPGTSERPLLRCGLAGIAAAAISLFQEQLLPFAFAPIAAILLSRSGGWKGLAVAVAAFASTLAAQCAFEAPNLLDMAAATFTLPPKDHSLGIGGLWVWSGLGTRNPWVLIAAVAGIATALRRNDSFILPLLLGAAIMLLLASMPERFDLYISRRAMLVLAPLALLFIPVLRLLESNVALRRATFAGALAFFPLSTQWAVLDAPRAAGAQARADAMAYAELAKAAPDAEVILGAAWPLATLHKYPDRIRKAERVDDLLFPLNAVRAALDSGGMLILNTRDSDFVRATGEPLAPVLESLGYADRVLAATGPFVLIGPARR